MHLISTLKLVKTPQKLCICNKLVHDKNNYPIYIIVRMCGVQVTMDVTISRQKLILLLRFACNTGLGPKGIGCVINKWQFCAVKLAKV